MPSQFRHVQFCCISVITKHHLLSGASIQMRFFNMFAPLRQAIGLTVSLGFFFALGQE